MTTTVAVPVTCYHCGEALASIDRGGWATFGHASGRTDHSAAIGSHTPQAVLAPTVRIVDHGGHLAVTVDRHDGRGEYLALTTPTHRGAIVVAAQLHGWAEAVDRARTVAGRIVGDAAASVLPIESESLAAV